MSLAFYLLIQYILKPEELQAGVDAHLLKRLGLTGQKLNNVTAGIRAIAASDEPIGQVAYDIAPFLYSNSPFCFEQSDHQSFKSDNGMSGCGASEVFGHMKISVTGTLSLLTCISVPLCRCCHHLYYQDGRHNLM